MYAKIKNGIIVDDTDTAWCMLDAEQYLLIYQTLDKTTELML